MIRHPGPVRHRVLMLVLLSVSLTAAEALGDLIGRLEPLPEVPVADLESGLLRRSVTVVIPPGARRNATLQALACAGQVRFRATGAGMLGKSLTAPGPWSSQVHPSGLRERGMVDQVRPLLEPWWSSSCGLDHDPQYGDWTATLPPAGHQRLIALLSLLGQPLPVVPPDLPAPETPHPAAPLGVTNWEALAARTGCPVASTVPWPAVPPVATVAELVPALAVAGIPAAWVHGALCLGDVRDRQDPAESTVIACLPVPPRSTPQAVLPAWNEPGWGVLIQGSFLIAIATPAALQDLQARLDAFDRGELP